jgi:hypothetical protein
VSGFSTDLFSRLRDPGDLAFFNANAVKRFPYVTKTAKGIKSELTYRFDRS